MKEHASKGFGLALAAAVAAAAIALASSAWATRVGLSALTISMVLGMILGNTLFPRVAPACAEGVDFSRTALLRAGIVLYGLRITFQQMAEVGWAGLIIDCLMVALTLIIAVQVGTRVLGLDRRTSALIGAGSAICGAAAILAAEPVLRARADKVSVAVATVVVFGTAAMFLYPALYPYLHLSQHAYGVFAGSTIHEVAQVVAASSISDSSAASAIVEKMLRVMMLAPILLLLSRTLRGGGARSGGRPAVPAFALLFVGACAVNSMHVVPPRLVQGLLQIDLVLLAMAMGALGLRTHAGAVRQAGFKPLLLAGCLFVFLTVGGYGVNLAVMHWMG